MGHVGQAGGGLVCREGKYTESPTHYVGYVWENVGRQPVRTWRYVAPKNPISSRHFFNIRGQINIPRRAPDLRFDEANLKISPDLNQVRGSPADVDFVPDVEFRVAGGFLLS